MDKQLQTIFKLFLLILMFYILYLLSPLIAPLTTVILWVATPLLIGLYAFYMLRPLRRFLEQKLKHKGLAFWATFIFFIVMLVLLFWVITDIVLAQVISFANTLTFEDFKVPFDDHLVDYIDLDDMFLQLRSKIPQTVSSLTTTLNTFARSSATFLTQVLLFFVTVFYLLKDEEILKNYLYQLTQGEDAVYWHKMFQDIHQILKDYISGQMLVSIILGILMFLFYSIANVPNALLLALISLVTNLILYIGPFLGAIPAIFIGATVSSEMLIQIIIATLVIQQIESSIVSPKVMGNKLQIHPFIVMIVVLLGLNVFGIIGALFATPIFLIIKIIFRTLRDIHKKNKLEESTIL